MSATLRVTLRGDLPIEEGGTGTGTQERVRELVVTDYETLSVRSAPSPRFPEGEVIEAISFEGVESLELVLDDADREEQKAAIAARRSS